MNDTDVRPVHVAADHRSLANVSVIVVGVGGLGTGVVQLLAQAGVGRLVLCDPDTVESSNLSRGSLFTTDHIGWPKVEAAAQVIRTTYPWTDVEVRLDDFRYAIGLGELRSADLVVSCLDSAADRIALSSRCIFSGNSRGLLDAGLHPWGGEVRHFTATGCCYACGCPPADRAMPTWRAACGYPHDMAASAPVVALMAAWQAISAIRLLLGEPEPEQIIAVQAPAGLSGPVHQQRAPDCPCHEVIDARHIKTTRLTATSTVAELLALTHDDERVQSWNPIDRRDLLSPLALRAADPERRLADLGIPADEILPVIRTRPKKHVRYLRLRGAR